MDYEDEIDLPGFLHDELEEYTHSGLHTGILIGSYNHYLRDKYYFWNYLNYYETIKFSQSEGIKVDCYKLALKNTEITATNLTKQDRAVMDIYKSLQYVIRDMLSIKRDREKIGVTSNYYKYSKLKQFSPDEKEIIRSKLKELLDDQGIKELLLGFHRDEVLYPERIGRLLLPYVVQSYYKKFPPLFIGSYIDNSEETRVAIEGNLKDWKNYLKYKIEDYALNILKLEKRVTSIHKSLNRRNPSLRSSSQIGNLINLLFEYPIITTNIIQRELGVSAVAANKLIKVCNDVGIIRNITNSGKNNKYICDDIILSLEQS